MQEYGSIAPSTVEKCLEAVSGSDDGGIVGTFTFAHDFPAFAGHFPGQPVLPAVVQLAAVRLLASRHLDAHLIPLKVDRAKFKAIIGPHEKVAVTIHLDRREGNIAISFTIRTAKGKAATGEISCLITDA